MPRKPNRKRVSSIVASPPATIQITTPPSNEAIRHEIVNRFWRSLNYISISVCLLVVYSCYITADYLLFSLIFWFMGDSIAQEPLIARVVRYLQIGIALAGILAAITHCYYSTTGQIDLDRRFSKEDSNEE